jgi:ABC-2 type transport system ATP-binding protein
MRFASQGGLMEVVLETDSLTKVYKSPIAQRRVRAVDSLSLQVFRGEIFGFLGPNGAGKTTAIKMFTTLLTPTSGEASILGRPLSDISLKKRIGFLPEQPYFYPYLSGAELLDFCAQIFGISSTERRERIGRLLKIVGLEGAGRRRVSTYSKGMLQRIGLAQALVNDPEFVILDEPLTGLDPVGRKDIRDVILGMKEKGRTVFFSSHILPDVEMICDRVGILIGGRLISVGRLDELLSGEVESIEVTAEGLPGKELRLLEEKADRVLASGDRVMLEMSSPDRACELEKAILDCGGRVISIIPRKKTLEELFIKEIGAYRQETHWE